MQAQRARLEPPGLLERQVQFGPGPSGGPARLRSLAVCGRPAHGARRLVAARVEVQTALMAVFEHAIRIDTDHQGRPRVALALDDDDTPERRPAA